MQIRCTHCTKTVALANSGELPTSCPHCAHRPGPEALGPYEPLRLIAAGGMGEVYLARHRDLGTEVAIKVLPAMPLDAIPALRHRFAREARLTAKVRHPGVVKVLGDDVAGDRPYLVLEYVAGQTLRERLHQGPLPVVEAARLAAATADVLAAAHREGVLHRDVKPDNVMVTPTGDVRVLDFGIARSLQDDAPLTRTGEIVGTPEYMAPEQLLDGPEAITERTDVHALGVLLHELLTARSPFHGANVFQALKLVESLVPPPPSSLQPDVPKQLDAVVTHALAKLPDERLPSATAFAAAVRAAVPAAVAAPSPHGAPPSQSLRWPLLAGALIAGAAILWSTRRPDPPPKDDPAAIAAVSAATAAATRATAEQQLHDGEWNQALAAADATSVTSTWSSPDLAREAFVLAHVAWPLAVGAPWWLGACDEARRTRLFGDRLEPGTDVTPLRAAWSGCLQGRPTALEASAAVRGDAASGALDRAELLRAHLTSSAPDLDAATNEPLRHDHDAHAHPGDALAQLLAIRLLPAEQRAAAFEAFAQRLPIAACEHWLALLCAHHLRGNTAEGTRAAEMAWLSGAGELAVLLDAWLQFAPLPGTTTWRRVDDRSLDRLRRRVAGADAADTPCRALLLACLDTVHGLDLDPKPLTTVPTALTDAASRWFVAATTAPARLPLPALRAAAALGAVPDYTKPPWRAVGERLRQQIDAEVPRGR